MSEREIKDEPLSWAQVLGLCALFLVFGVGPWFIPDSAVGPNSHSRLLILKGLSSFFWFFALLVAAAYFQKITRSQPK